MTKYAQLSTILDHKKHGRVRRTVKFLLSFWYDRRTCGRILDQLKSTISIFRGHFKGYRACNTEYHDLSHTIDVFVATVRLIDGWNLTNNEPLPAVIALQLCIAAAYHDVGYIQESWDTQGTGAKYSKAQALRSVAFVQAHHEQLAIEADLLPGISTMILGTDPTMPWETFHFDSAYEHEATCLLASADLMGQMSDRAYLEKLLFLFYEFQEAHFPGYETAFDILKKTAGFYEFTRIRMDTLLQKQYEYARPHFKRRFDIDANLYMEAIERQMAYLQAMIEDSSTNFRKKLKRLDLEKIALRQRA